MAQLSSPGVSVTVIDESFYTPGAPGTVPLIIVASTQDKQNSAGTGIAPGTLKMNTGIVYLLTSQSDLGSTFGVPFFQTDAENNPINAGELNEYGLQAAYSFLGVSNRAYVVRADIDTSQLIGTAVIPTGAPADGTYWFDTSDSAYGIFEWNANQPTVSGGQTFTAQTVTVITNTSQLAGGVAGNAPASSFGSTGSYALVATTTLNKLYYKKGVTDGILAAGWYEVGTTQWAASRPTAISTAASPSLTATGISIAAAIIGNGAASPAAGTILTVTGAVTGGSLSAGEVITGGTTAAGTEITAVNTATFTGSVSSTTLTVTAVASGTISVGMVITGLTPSTVYVVANLTGSSFASGGGTSTWTLSASATGTPTAGTSYTVSASQLVASTPMTTGGTVLTINNGTSTANVTGVSTVAALATAINTVGLSGVTAGSNGNTLIIYSTGVNVTLSGTAATTLGFSTLPYLAPTFTASQHYNVPLYGIGDQTSYANGYPTGSVWMKTTNVNLGANIVVKVWQESTDAWVLVPTQVLPNNGTALATLDPTGGGINLTQDAVYVKFNDSESVANRLADFKIYYRTSAGTTTITSSPIGVGTFTLNTAYNFTISETSLTNGSADGNGYYHYLTNPVTVSFTGTGQATSDANNLTAAIQSALVGQSSVSVTLNSNNTITITHNTGGDIVFVDGASTAATLSNIFTAGTTTNYYSNPTGTGTVASLWGTMMGNTAFATPSPTPLTTTPANGTYWYDSYLGDVDIMINNGTSWVGYRSLDVTVGQTVIQGGKSINNPLGTQGTTDINGPIVSATQPTTQSTGAALANGDLWIDTSDIENYPIIHKFNFATQSWTVVNNQDHTDAGAIVFSDARWSDNSTNGALGAPFSGAGAPDTIASLLASNFVDFDCVSPVLYPKGTLLFNTRRSSFNVKKYEAGYVVTSNQNTNLNNAAMTYYYPDRWVTAAANDSFEVGQFGRKAQRAVVLAALEATIQSNQNIRQPDTVIYNLLSCPGYLETVSALVGLNTDNGTSAFIVADAPARLTPDATSLSNWGNNAKGAVIDGDIGLIENNAYSAVYYPWALTQDLHGNNIVVPPSYVMLRTIALSDNVSYPWFAPAGVRRGGVTNAASVGYVVGDTGEYYTVALNQGQRDTLAGIHVNPITYIAGTGLVCYGQYTRQLVASSLDRINVARLVIYLRYQLNVIAKPFIFEPNDAITRNEIKQQIEKLMLDLTSKRALYDFLVVCDSSNNTPARIDASELHVDIAIEPVKAVEFIYIPLRLENTGGIKGLSGA